MSTYSSEAAEQVVRMTLEGAEVAVKLAGSGARQLAVLLYAVLRDQKKTKGKIRLTGMLRSGKELKVFAVRDGDVETFCTEAKKYGVLYTILKDRDASDGLTDVMVRAEDAGKINRIFERFRLTTVEMGGVKAEVRPTRGERSAAPARTMTHRETVDEFLDGILKPKEPEKESRQGNPTGGRTAASPPSAPFSGTRSTTEERRTGEPERKPSVKKQLDRIREEQRKAETQKGNRPAAAPAAPKRRRRPKREEIAV